MTTAAEQAFERLKGALVPEGSSDWFEISQDRIDAFADATNDHNLIHVDPERSPFGTTIAHGFLTLSLLTYLDRSIPRDRSLFEGAKMALNYGFDKVRFISPVKVGSRIRATGELIDVVLKGDAVVATRRMTIEIHGEEKPACIADWQMRVAFA